MHNRKRSGQGLGYVLAALMVVSCGGGGGGSLTLSGKSDNTLGFVTDTSVAIPVPYKGGAAALVLSVKDRSGAGVANQVVTLTITGPGTFLRGAKTITGTTSAVPGQVGNVTFQVIGGDIEGDGTVTASYTDAAGNQSDPVAMNYTVVNPGVTPSAFVIADPVFLGAGNAVMPGNLLLPTSGNTSATIKIRIKEPLDATGYGKTTNEGSVSLSFPVGSEALQSLLSTTRPVFVKEAGVDEKGNDIYSVSVGIDADGQRALTGAHGLVVTYTDKNLSKTTSTIPFSIVDKFSVVLRAEKSELKTGSDTVKLTAIVVDASSGRVPNQSVIFKIGDGMPKAQSACSTNPSGIGDVTQYDTGRPLDKNSKGDLSSSSSLTDVNGIATTNLLVSDWRNGSRRIYAVVDSDAVSEKPVDCVDVQLTGSKIELSPEIVNTASGVAFPVTAKVTNGLGNVVSGASITLSGDGVAASQSKTTNNSGLASFTMAPSAVGGTVSAVSRYATSIEDNASPLNTVAVDVSSKNLAVQVLDGALKPVKEDLRLNTSYTVKVKADNAGVPLAGNVIASTSLGTLSLPSPAVLDAAGEMTAILRSVEPGTAFVNVRVVDSVTNKVTLLSNEAVSFAATIPAKITALALRTTLDRKESTEIVARVLDKDDYPVKGQFVQFNTVNDTSGGGFTGGNALVATDSDGIAKVSYTAGNTDTAKDYIQITASLQDPAFASVKVKEPVFLTVSGSPVSVTLGTGNKIAALSDTTYSFAYQVMVTNAAGGPVANQEVTLTVIPTYYLKGFYYYNSVAKSWLPKAIDRTTFKAMTFGYIVSGADTAAEMPPIACLNEDTNLNGRLDPGEDLNGDLGLWPLNPVTVSQKVVKTNSSGYVDFDVIYAKSYANWLQVKLTASTGVTGSESTSESEFTLPAMAADLSNEAVSPPGGLRSAFGQTLVTLTYTPDSSVPPVYNPTSASIKTGSAACKLKLNDGGILPLGLPDAP
ncbi:MAG: hypothetical protein Q7T36_06605 [Fluviicoccus sp.]|uniref:hypothetical protein n=1 Tax=Fluviicoccus sp. TaxID=2003552 RepID=UPI002721BB71|nr:hypothetical protein [Fluviicoccus sp.]MDO8330124.1 hypothetical protein [Fluviicoccus sp.]